MALVQIMVNRGTWLRNLVNIKEINKQAKGSVKRSFSAHLLFFKGLQNENILKGSKKLNWHYQRDGASVTQKT